MFDRVVAHLESLAEGTPHDFDEQEKRTALAALFYHMVAVDGVVTESENATLCNILQQRFGLTHEQVAALSERGRAEDMVAPGVFAFTTIINAKCDEEERRAILADMRRLARADGTIVPIEREFLAHLAVMLKVK